jgi:hypothetical protein
MTTSERYSSAGYGPLSNVVGRVMSIVLLTRPDGVNTGLAVTPALYSSVGMLAISASRLARTSLSVGLIRGRDACRVCD